MGEKFSLTPLEALWSAAAVCDHLEIVKEAHLDYIQAGSDIITSSCTYQASLEGFQSHFKLSKDEATELLKTCLVVAFQAREEAKQFTNRPLGVAISLGPYGAVLADGSEYDGCYRNSVSKEELKAFHRERLELYQSVLEMSDLTHQVMWLAETIPCLVEVEALLEALFSLRSSFPFAISVSGHREKPGYLASGEKMEDLFSLITEHFRGSENRKHLLAVGCNCTPPHLISSFLQIARNHLDPAIYLMVYPNSGEQWNADSKTWGALHPFGEIPFPEDYSIADGVPSWYQEGARVFGGCCRTSPEDISRIATTLEKCKNPTEQQ